MTAATEGLTFEKVWAMFQETGRQMKETDRLIQETGRQMKETDRRMKELSEEADKQMKELRESMQETGRLMHKTDWKISKLGDRLGDLIVHMMASNIRKKLRDLGYVFESIARNKKIEDENRNILAEIDILLENGRYVMIVEVKSLFNLGDVKKHLKRMATIRAYADAHNDRRTYLAAAAGALFDERGRVGALENGMFVIQQAGDGVNITPPPAVREWLGAEAHQTEHPAAAITG